MRHLIRNQSNKAAALCIKAIFLLAILAAPFSVRAQGTQDDRVKGWSADIDTLLSIMKTQHYVYKSKPLPPEVINGAVALKTKIPQYSDERMFTELERITYYMHDGHSYILPVSRKFPTFYLPIQVYIFSDGTYVVDTDGSNKDLIGSKVVRINGVPVEKLEDDMNSFIHQDNLYTVKWFAPSILRFRSLYESYGMPAGSPDVSIDLLDRNNKPLTRKIAFVPAADFHGIPKQIPSQVPGAPIAPLYLTNVGDSFWFKKLDNKTLYFQFNQVEDKNEETLGAFGRRFGDTLQADKPKLLIVDVRNNNGGNLDLLGPLMDGISAFEKANPQSKIVIITGRNTFSAAQVFISLMNKNTHALFAGEPSGSSPNFVGEGNYIVLPYSGAMGSISNKYHESIPGDTRKWIEPNIPVALSSAAYFQNQDPVLEAILKKFR
jgi:hypothetical protein